MREIPKYYRDQLIPVSVNTENRLAWTKELVLEFISDDDTVNFVVLGGDVIQKFEGHEGFEYTYDNWYVQSRPPTSDFGPYALLSRDTTKKYIQSYPEKNVLFLLSITADVTAGLR